MNADPTSSTSGPHLLFVRAASLYTEFGHLLLQDPEHPDLAPGRRAGGAVGAAGTGMIQLFCLGESPQPHVEIRVWSGPRPDRSTDTDDAERFEAGLDARHALLVLGSPTAAPTDILVTLLRPGRYLVRAARRDGPPRPDVTRPELDVTPEHWVIDLWLSEVT